MQHIHLLSMGRYKLIILHLQLTPVWWRREQLLLRLLFTNKNNIILIPEGEDSHRKMMGVIVWNFEKNPLNVPEKFILQSQKTPYPPQGR